jgi:two-component system, LytTR family, response regulator
VEDGMTHSIRTLIVDDEPVARRRLLHLIAAHSDILVVGEAADGREALERVATLQPELVFLDVEMPGLGGIEAAQALGGPRAPSLVFATAHDRFAASAFTLDAVDYLLKPFDSERFAVAIGRVRRRLFRTAGPPAAPRDRLLALVRGEARLLRVDDILLITSAGNYAEVTLTGGARYLVRETLTALAVTLPPEFVRVSRSIIVRSDRVAAAASAGHGDALLTLIDGATVRLSRTYRSLATEQIAALRSRASQD